MTPIPTKYGSGIISNRSRRLRTIAAVLMVFIIAMAIYGSRVLVPRINRAAAIANRPVTSLDSRIVPGGVKKKPILNLSPEQARALRIDVIVEAAYWVVWILLVLSLLLVAWLDLREVSRTYLNQRRELWSTAARAASEEPERREIGSDPPVGT